MQGLPLHDSWKLQAKPNHRQSAREQWCEILEQRIQEHIHKACGTTKGRLSLQEIEVEFTPSGEGPFLEGNLHFQNIRADKFPDDLARTLISMGLAMLRESRSFPPSTTA